jgi:hypothetical protein
MPRKRRNENLFCWSGGVAKEKFLYKKRCGRLFSFFYLLFPEKGQFDVVQRFEWVLNKKKRR